MPNHCGHQRKQGHQTRETDGGPAPGDRRQLHEVGGGAGELSRGIDLSRPRVPAPFCVLEKTEQCGSSHRRHSGLNPPLVTGMASSNELHAHLMIIKGRVENFHSVLPTLYEWKITICPKSDLHNFPCNKAADYECPFSFDKSW